MADETSQMKPIWHFVGLILLVMGGVILLTGLYIFFVRPIGPVMVELLRNPGLWLGFKLSVIVGPPRATVLASLHPDIWWGGFMVVCGLLFILLRKRGAGPSGEKSTE